MGCVPYQMDTGCAPEWSTLDPDLQERAEALAWSTVRLLTGGRVGSCPVLMRPCVPRMCPACAGWYDYLSLRPYIWEGRVYNAYPCGQDGCSCPPVSEVRFPGPVAAVSQVLIDGAPLDEGAYRLDEGRLLVRTDGSEWPSCQDMSAPVDQPGTFAVSYTPGVLPGPDGLWAAGVLAHEFSKACQGAKCRLPSSVASVSRQGVSMEFDNSMFSNGLTGIREVDAWVLSVNPNRLRNPPRVWSPDAPAHRWSPQAATP